MEQIGGVKLNYECYKGEDIYSDGEIEDHLLQIVKDNDDFKDVIKTEKSWPILYHLSEVRGNIINWLDLESSTVLEIGAGCGAITSTLCKKAKTVVANDLSKRRCLINAYRNKRYDNLEIYVGNFLDVATKLDKKFDLITLIGVLEYADSYIGGDFAHLKFLEHLKKFLDIDGKIIIAIENRFGLKYWAGCKEDHVAKYFEGLEDYSNTSGVRTFSRQELIDLFDEAGLEYKFYYPYPDYKLPTTIYSDDYLPEKGELINNIRNFDGFRYVMFDESKVFDGLIESHLFAEFSNSFLIVLEKGAKE